MHNGVDISDTTQYFLPKEYNKLGSDGRKLLNKCPKRKAANIKRGGNRNKKRKEDDPDEANRHVAAIINEVMKATRSEGSVVSFAPDMPQHGPHTRARSVEAVSANGGTSSTNASVISQVTYDHLGNVVP